MKPIAVQRSWEKNSRVGRSFWLLSRIGQRFGAFRKGRVKRAEPQRPLSFLGSFSPASKTALGKWSSPNPARSRLRLILANPQAADQLRQTASRLGLVLSL